MVWQLQTAKAKLSELLRRARADGPQTITVRGQDAYVVLTKEAFDKLAANDPSAKPKTGLDLFRPILGLGVENLQDLIGPRSTVTNPNREIDFSGPEWDELDKR